MIHDLEGKQRQSDKHGGENEGLDLPKQGPLTDCVNRLPYVAFILFRLLCQNVKFVVPSLPDTGFITLK